MLKIHNFHLLTFTVTNHTARCVLFVLFLLQYLLHCLTDPPSVSVTSVDLYLV
jgi:hypothetical protein